MTTEQCIRRRPLSRATLLFARMRPGVLAPTLPWLVLLLFSHMSASGEPLSCGPSESRSADRLREPSYWPARSVVETCRRSWPTFRARYEYQYEESWWKLDERLLNEP
jgi:hypothetical protein